MPRSNVFSGLKVPKLLRDLIVLGTGHLFARVATFAAFAYLARVLSPDAYGAVEYAIGLTTVAVVICDGGIGSIGVRRVTQKEETLERMAKLAPAAQMILALIVVPAAWIYALATAENSQTLSLVGVMLVSVLILPLKQDWLFQSVHQMNHIFWSQTLRAIAFVLGVVLLVKGDHDLVRVGLIETAGVAAATGYLLLRQVGIAPIGMEVRPKALMGIAKEASYVGLLATLWPISQFAPVLLVTQIQGLEETGYFGAAHRIAMALTALTNIYHFNLYPTLARGISEAPEEAAALAQASVRITAWGSIGLALACTLLAEPIMVAVFGAPFAVAAPALAILIWTFPIALISGHTRWMLVAARGARDMVIAQGAGLAVLLASGPFLIIKLGAVGGAVAMLACNLAVWVLSQMFAGRRVEGASMRACLLPTLAALAVIAAAYLVKAPVWPTAAAGLAVFAAAMAIFDRALIGDVLRLAHGRATPAEAG